MNLLDNNNIDDKLDGYNDVVDEFEDKFIKKLPKDYKKVFDRNKKDLTIKTMDFFSKANKTRKVLGDYDINDNKIRLFTALGDSYTEVNDRLFHELLHVASRKTLAFTGLEYNQLRSYGVFVLGKGLNEGYTELLNQRYFSKNLEEECYSDLKVLAAGIEKIVGKEVMEEIYFKGTVFDLINHMSLYTDDKEEALNLIFEIDNYKKEYNPKERRNQFRQLKEKIALINNNKLNIKFVNDEISYNEYEKSKYTDLYLYIKNNYIYNDMAYIVETEDYLITISEIGIAYEEKDKIELHFKPDFEYNKNSRNKKIGGMKNE